MSSPLSHLCRLGLSVLLVASMGLPAARARGERPSPPEKPPHVMRRGSEIVFHGWSRDSKYVAYTRHRFASRPEQTERQRMHRQVRQGEFTGFGSKVGGDVELHAQRSRYVATPLPWRRTSETSLEFLVGERVLDLALDVGRDHGWRLRDGDRVLADHRFDRIYVGFRADIFPSPDGRQAIVVMHLDSGWDIDAAAFPVELSTRTPPSITPAPIHRKGIEDGETLIDEDSPAPE